MSVFIEGDTEKELDVNSEIIPWFSESELLRLYLAAILTSELMASTL
jgi:hypothetical protein